MRILRRLFLLFLLGLLAVWAVLIWLQTPKGAQVVSDRLTAKIQASAPGTRIDVAGLKLQWPPAVTAEKADWTGSDGKPIVALREARIAPGWKSDGRVGLLDLAALDRSVAGGGWKSHGTMRGSFGLLGRKGEIEEVELRLKSDPPGGTLNSEVLERLAEMLPPGDTRGILLRALGAKATFNFTEGKIDLVTEGENHVMNLFLDGDHLLDLKIRLPKDSIGLLKETNLWK